MAEGQRFEGVVRSYEPGKGTGVIELPSGEELPVHRSALADEGLQALHRGDVVTFRIGRNRFGRRAALEVERVGWEEEDDSDTPREWSF